MASDRTGTPAALHPRVLVPILVIGGGLALVQVAIPGARVPAGWARACQATTGLGVWAFAVWVMLRGVSRGLIYSMCLFADVAIVLGALAQNDPGAGRTSVAMFGLPTVILALFGSVSMLAVQAVAVTLGSLVLLQYAGLPPAMLAVQVGAALLATISPAVAVIVLRRRLDAALRRERMLSSTDPLTRAVNRRGLEDAVPETLERARMTRLPLGLAVIDVDHFKQVNDRYGHVAGDVVLQQVSDLIRECVRAGDLVCRLGGEEFAVLAVITPEHLVELGERIRRTIEEQAPYQVTVSIGATWCAPWPDVEPIADVPAMNAGDVTGVSTSQATERLWALIDRADELMYAAKNSGRNRMIFAAISS